MLFCNGDPVLFGLFASGILTTLIGGMLFGQGQYYENQVKFIIGLVLLVGGAILLIIGSIVIVIKKLKFRRKEKMLEIERENMFKKNETAHMYVNEGMEHHPHG